MGFQLLVILGLSIVAIYIGLLDNSRLDTTQESQYRIPQEAEI